MNEQQQQKLIGILTDRVDELQREVTTLKELWAAERVKVEEREKEIETLRNR